MATWIHVPSALETMMRHTALLIEAIKFKCLCVNYQGSLDLRLFLIAHLDHNPTFYNG